MKNGVFTKRTVLSVPCSAGIILLKGCTKTSIAASTWKCRNLTPALAEVIEKLRLANKD